MRTENINNLLKLLHSLKNKEQFGQEFTAQSIADETPYKASSVRKYLSSFLREYCFFSKENNSWYCSGITNLTDYDFLALMSQNKINDSLTDIDKLVQNLFLKSKNAFLSSIQLYNNPNQLSRVELFTILIANSWELLLKAEIVQKEGLNSIYKKHNQDTISCRNALNKVYSENNNIRKNIEVILDIRDQAVHLALNELQHDLCRIFQSTIFNYNKKFNELTGATPLPPMNSGLLNLIVDGHSTSITLLKQRYGTSSTKIMEEFLNKLKIQSNELNSTDFAIPIEYKLCLTKTESDSDISFSTGSNGAKAIRIYQPIDPTRSHPYKTFEAIGVINSKIIPQKIGSGIFYKIIKKYQIKTKSEFFYLNESTSRYSEKFIDWCTKNINQHEHWLEQL
ncbi:DUF3644 domain-containing protein [Legionella fairfieldensis]|uniref:DUF3644 domain-containing protein n=1 Tax=Legionella fairfieldensis TaxID=45064 RepID=UPI00048EF73C|nr:DUF3644 domain-containing protein [Legionella fairfieldensis]